jgi:type II secretory pathway pseudopilin PulG
MKKRLGYSLIETLVVIAGSGVVLATAVGLLHSMFGVDRTTRDRAAGQQMLRRLAADFRDDAHAAVKLATLDAVVDGKKLPAWEFQMPQADRKVQYRAISNRLVREKMAGGKTVRREVYRLPDGSAASIRLDNGPPALATLRIAVGAAGENQAGGLPLRIDAALGSDYRFAKAGGK